MKNVLLTLIVLSFSAISASAIEPLIILPLGYEYPPAEPAAVQNTANTVSHAAPAAETTVKKTPQYPPNMVPQNAAAEGLPVVKKTPSNRINIVTKQGSRTNTQWNPGGKGTRSYF